MQLLLQDLLSSTLAISPSAGQKAYQQVAQLLKTENESPIEISFKGITQCTSSFTNAFVGKLYLDFPSGELQGRLHFSDVKPIWQQKLESAKQLGSNPKLRQRRKEQLANLEDE